MGNSLGELADQALSEYLVVKGKVSIGLQSATYRVTDARVKPLELGSGLCLTGIVKEIEVKSNTVGAVFSALSGGSQNIAVTVRGVRLVVKQSAGEGTTQKPNSSQQNLEQHLRKMVVKLSDVQLDVDLAGHKLNATIDSSDIVPHVSRSELQRWRLEHRGGRLCLAGDQIGKMQPGSISVDVTGVPQVNVGTKIAAQLDSNQVLAILDIAAALEALAACTASESAPCDLKDARLNFGEVSVQVDEFGGPLLKLMSPSSTVTIGRHNVHVEILPLHVTSGESAAVSSNLSLEIRTGIGNDWTMQHSFSPESFPPWQSAVDMLLADPKFAPHKALLDKACTAIEVKSSRKRPLEKADSSPERLAKRRP